MFLGARLFDNLVALLLTNAASTLVARDPAGPVAGHAEIHLAVLVVHLNGRTPGQDS